MTAWICKTCGNQQADTTEPPARCAICDDPRQYVGWRGQEWTTLDGLARRGHRTQVHGLEPGLYGIGVAPRFAIGQRSLLVCTGEGNALWDLTGFVDEDAFAAVRSLGGVDVISASHPHFYGVMVEWAHAFDARIVLPRADREWILRPDPSIELYDDTAEVAPGVTLVQCGGHFPGSAVLHWADGAEGRGVLLTGDTVTVVQDRAWVSIMWSYPNLVPLDAATLRAVQGRLDPLPYDRIYGGWWGRVVAQDARARVAASIDRYIAMIGH